MTAIPQDLLDALSAVPEAEAFFRTLSCDNLFPIYYRLQTAEWPETRAHRMLRIRGQIGQGVLFH